MKTIEKEIRERFIGDMNIPIQVYHSPYFEERIEMLNPMFHSKDKWEQLNTLIDERFNSSPQKFLEEYHKVRNNIILTLSESEAFKTFNNDKSIIEKYGIKSVIPNRCVYTCEQAKDNYYFLSIDLKKANFQALKYYNPELVMNTKSYEELIYIFTDLEYIAKSKYTRQVVFGKMNPSKTITIEKYMIIQILESDLLKQSLLPIFDVFSVNNDEIILKIKKDNVEQVSIMTPYFLSILESEILKNLGIEVKIELFKIIAHQFKLGFSDVKVLGFEKNNLNPDKINEWKGISSIYYPQIYKLLNNLPITDNDMVFYNNHELVKFIHPLELNK